MAARALAAAILFIAASASAAAQTYSASTPAPRSTDVGALRAIAQQREVHERFSLGIDDELHGRWSNAAAEFERIVALSPAEPQYSTAQYDAGIAYANLGRLDDAARAFRIAIARDPGFLAAMANLIAIDLQRNDPGEARQIADRFASIAPDSARAMYLRGITALRQGDYAAARESFGGLLHVNPQYAIAYYDLAVADAQLGAYASAERELRSALDLAPGYARAQFALGAVLLHEGRRTEARSAFDSVVRDAGDDPALRNLAQTMRDAIKAP
jgi:tetratricopeptide (TPR) repeat protein